MIDPAEMEMIRAAVALLSSVGKEPSIRRVAALIELAHGKRGLRWATVAAALKVLPGNTSGNTPATVGQQFDEGPATVGQHAETATCERADLSRVVIDSGDNQDILPTPIAPAPAEAVGETVEPPALFAVPEPVAKPVKPKRITSAYAGTTLESFGHLVPLVTAVLAVDGHGTETKAFATSLQSLAMWRALHGDAALAYGLTEAATRQKGHRYAGAVAGKYVPDEHRAPLRAVEREDDDIPTRADLVAQGLTQPIGSDDIPAHKRPPWHPLYRPLVASA